MRHLLFPIALAVVSMGCEEPALILNRGYCERPGGSDADCVFFGPEKDGDKATLGWLAVKSRAAGGGFVRRAGKKTYTLHSNGKLVGSVVFTGDHPDWIDVTLTDGPPYKKSMRIDGPGGLME